MRVSSERLMGTLSCYQNFHAVHHIYPGVPFYLWKKLWRRDEADYLANGVPISKAWGGTLTAAEYWSRRGTDPGPPPRKRVHNNGDPDRQPRRRCRTDHHDRR